MMLVQKLSWEFFPQGSGVWLWEFLDHCWGQTLMLGGKTWPTVSALIHPKGVLWGWDQDFLAKLPHPCGPCFVPWCTVMSKHEEGHLQSVPTKLEAGNCPERLGRLKHWELLSLVLRGGGERFLHNPPPVPWITFSWREAEKRESLLQRTRLHCSRV